MKFELKSDQFKIINRRLLNSGTINFYNAEVDMDNVWEKLYVEMIMFKNSKKSINRAVVNNKVNMDQIESGCYTIGFIGYLLDDNVKVKQISTNLERIRYEKGAGEIESLDINPSAQDLLFFDQYVKTRLDELNGEVIGVTFDDKANKLETSKNNIKNAIENKGVLIDENIPFSEYANKVNEITATTKLQIKTVNPLTESQIVQADENYDGLKSVNINAVTKDIDLNIIPNNIKKGITILGVEGVIEGGINTDDATATAEDIVKGKTAYANGKKLIGTNTYNAKMNTINYGTSFKIIREILELPLISITNVTNMQEAFSHCERITTIPLLDTKKVTNMSSAFEYCFNLKNIPQIDTGKVQNLSSLFAFCSNLESLPELNFESAINVSNFFAQVFNVTNLGGFDNLGKAYIEKQINYARYALKLSSCEKLTHDSIMNVINNLYDLNLNENLSVDGVCQYTQSLNLGATNLAKLTDEEKAIAVSKGWTLS